MKSISIVCFLLVSIALSGQTDKLKTFENEVEKFLNSYVIDGYVDYNLINKSSKPFDDLIPLIGNMDKSALDDSEKQSFYINAYNILVVHQIIENYPTASVKEISGFFSRVKYNVGGEQLTLNEIEKNRLIEAYKDSRFHFVLVCGAKDCPKLWNHAFTSDMLEQQLTDRSKAALNDPVFLKNTDGGYGLSEIFKWNRFEFGGKKDMIAFINTFRDIPIEADSKTYYYEYDWTLNDTRFAGNSNFNTANNSFRYVTSAAIPKGGIEIKIFNNLYSQLEKDGSNLENRSTYFTSSLSFLYGKTNRFNIGFVSRYRRVLISSLISSPLDVFTNQSTLPNRQRITAIGPQIRWAPSKSWTNFSIQSSFTFPVGSDLSGNADSPFLDWAGPVFLTQFFNDKSIGDKFSLFTEIDLLIEEIGGSGKANRVSTPVTGILSWFPRKNVTLYGLVGYSPYLESPYDYFLQAGLGFKYQVSPDFEIELLVTDFSNRYLNSIGGEAATYNIGFRYSR